MIDFFVFIKKSTGNFNTCVKMPRGLKVLSELKYIYKR